MKTLLAFLLFSVTAAHAHALPAERPNDHGTIIPGKPLPSVVAQMMTRMLWCPDWGWGDCPNRQGCCKYGSLCCASDEGGGCCPDTHRYCHAGHCFIEMPPRPSNPI